MPPKKKRKASPAGQSERAVRARTDDVESPTAHELGQPYPAEGADVKTVIYANAKAGTVFMDEKDAVVIKRSEHLPLVLREMVCSLKLSSLKALYSAGTRDSRSVPCRGRHGPSIPSAIILTT